MTFILTTQQISKRFEHKTVVSDVNMNVKQGEIYGLLGPNGAGKSTLLRMITGLIQPTTGKVKWFGEPFSVSAYDLRKRMGILIEYPVFYEHLSAYQNLILHCEYMGFYDRQAIEEALEYTQLSTIAEKPVEHLSLGMKQRLGIARALCTRPEFLILDEPTNGLDPVGIRELRNLFHTLNKEYGMTLLITSHILQEMEHLADTIGMMNEGQLLKEVPMTQIRTQQSEYIELELTDSQKAAVVIETKLHATNYKVIDPHRIRIYDPNVSPVDLSKTLVLHQVGIASLNKKKSSLEDYFLTIIQGGDTNAETHKVRI